MREVVGILVEAEASLREDISRRRVRSRSDVVAELIPVISIVPATKRVGTPAAVKTAAKRAFVSQSFPAFVCRVASGPFIRPV